MQPTATQGTDRIVKTVSLQAQAAGTVVLLAAVAETVYRVVGFQVSFLTAGTFDIFHGASTDPAKTIAAGYAAANGGSNGQMNDWAPQVGVKNEAVSMTTTGGDCTVVLHYIEIKVLG